MALVAGLDLTRPVEDVLDRGAAFVPRPLDQRFLRRLRRELESGPFRRFQENFGLVRQRIDGFDIPAPFEGFPLVAELVEELAALVHSQGREIRGLATWVPNEAGVARYPRDSFGITPHLDGKRYRRLGAVITVFGTARFAVCRDRAGEVVASWDAIPGSLTLLRGPGLGGRRDGRPFHTVGRPRRGERCSLGLRMSAG
jgi:hypothetical protein